MTPPTDPTNYSHNDGESPSIIFLLQENFEANEKKRTCRDCLRSRAVPSTKVVEVTKQLPDYELTYDCFCKAQGVLLNEYCHFDQRDRSSLFYMDRIGTITRFVQLLFYHAQRQQGTGRSQASSASSETQILSLDQADKLSSNLLETLIRELCSFVNEQDAAPLEEDDYNPMTEDASQALDARTILCFTFGSLLRLNFYAKARPNFLATLWKGFCELAVSVHSHHSPTEQFLPLKYCSNAINAIAKILDEGSKHLVMFVEQWLQTNSFPIPPPQHTFQCKLIGFLVARVSTLLSIQSSYQDEPVEDCVTETGEAAQTLWESFATLRGATDAIQHNLSKCANNCDSDTAQLVLKNYGDVANKVDKCVVGVLLPFAGSIEDKSAHFIHRPSLDGLLAIPTHEVNSGKKHSSGTLSYFALVLGRAFLLQRMLLLLEERIKSSDCQYSNDDIESMLILCEVYQSVALPQCHAPLSRQTSYLSARPNDIHSPLNRLLSILVHDCVESMATVLASLDANINESSKRAQFHRLLIRWMSPPSQSPMKSFKQQHPLSREFVLSLIHRFVVIGGERDKRDEARGRGPGSMAFVVLLVRLLFDARTVTSLRSCLAALILRLLQSMLSVVGNNVAGLIEAQFLSLLRASAKERKRKRNTSDPSDTPSTIRCYDTDAVLTICQVLAQLKKLPTTNDSDILTLQSCCKDLQDLGNNVGSNFQTSLLISYLQGTVWMTKRGEQSSDAVEAFGRCTGLDAIPVFRAMIQCTIDNIQDILAGDVRRLQQKVCSCRVVLRFSSAVCERLGRDRHGVPVELLCQLISVCTSTQFFPTNTKQDGIQGFRVAILFEAIGLLGSVGKVVPQRCPEAVLQAIQSTFSRLLSSRNWPIVSRSLSALVSFGSTVPPSHQQLLPTCLPQECMGPFQARVKGKVWKDSKLSDLDRTVDTSDQVGRKLGSYVQQRELGSSIFPSMASYHIVPGSYFLQMPTQEGRQALVIFPPGSQSMDDIRHLNDSTDDGDLPPIHVLKRVRLAADMGGCKCLLTST